MSRIPHVIDNNGNKRPAKLFKAVQGIDIGGRSITRNGDIKEEEFNPVHLEELEQKGRIVEVPRDFDKHPGPPEDRPTRILPEEVQDRLEEDDLAPIRRSNRPAPETEEEEEEQPKKRGEVQERDLNTTRTVGVTAGAKVPEKSAKPKAKGKK